MSLRRTKRHKYFGGLVWVISILTFFIPMNVKAEGERVVSTLVKDNSIYVYVQGISEIQSGSTVQIGNTVCQPENLSMAKLADLEEPMRTIILLDNSMSISTSYHEDIQEVLTDLIEGALEKEVFKIGLISDKITYFGDYTNDKESLKQIVNDLTYQNQNTYLSDVLYEEIMELNKENAGIFTRIIIIADGADDKTIGYTNEEVCRLIEKSAYPVYAVGTQEKNNDKQLETLFSFSRAGGIEGCLLNKDTNNNMILQVLQKDRADICIRIMPDENLLDGSNKSILLKLNTTEGQVQLVTAADMPFGNVTETMDEEETDKEQTDESKDESVLPVMSATQEEESENSEVPMAVSVLSLIVGALIIVVCIVFFLYLRKKKITKKRSLPLQPESVSNIEDKDDDRTILIDDVIGQKFENINDEDVIRLWKKKYILMKCVERKEKIYKELIMDSIRIGRVDKDINIDEDRKVSRSHCEIILRGSLLYIKDSGAINKTYYQDRIVDTETPLVSGGIVKIGSYHYSVELIEE